MTPMLKYMKNKETGEPDKQSLSLRVKVPYYDGVWKPNIFNLNHEKIFPTNDVTLTPMDFIHKGDQIATVIQCGGIWYANGKFGVTWRLLQAVAQPKIDTNSVCQIELDETDKDKIQSNVSSTEDDDEEEEDIIVEDDEEEDEEEEEQPEAVAQPEPEPVKKKKVVRKKTSA